MYFGWDGQALLERVADDPLDINGFGVGRIFAFNGADGHFSNLVGNQFTSNIASTNQSIGFRANNGALFGYLGHAGASPAISTWANRALLFNGGGSVGWVYNAVSTTGDHQWQISSNTVMLLNSLGLQFNKLQNGTGMQIASGSLCAAPASGACSATITIPVAEPDTAYIATGCVVQNNATGAPFVSTVVNTAVSSFSVNILNPSGSATTTGIINCLVTHN